MDHELANSNPYTGDILTIKVQADPLQEEITLPTTTVQRPCYLVDLRGVDVPAENTHAIRLKTPTSLGSLRWKPTLASKWGDWYKMDHIPDESEIESSSLGYLTGGAVHEIHVWGMTRHPFHLHVNPYQLLDWADKLHDPYFKAGDWHDVFMHSDDRYADDAPVRLQTDRFGQEMVIHCHFLDHEDEGMMAWLWIEGGEGQFWDGAKDVDPSCVRSRK